MRSRPRKRNKKDRPRSSGGLVSSWARTDVGLKREKNEDSFWEDSNLMCYVVADGMGGHAAGEKASRMAVEILRERIREARNATSPLNTASDGGESAAVLDLLQQAIGSASQKIKHRAEQNPELEGMGTTVTMMLFCDGRAYVAHVGDSRLYRFSDGRLEQLTEDHSLVNEQIKAGFITAEEAQFSRYRNIITRSVGFESEVTADTFSLVARPGDVFLLCSDGLTGMVHDEVLRRVLKSGDFDRAASQLIQMANQSGGEDNITLILLRYKGQSGWQAPRPRKAAWRGWRKGIRQASENG
ncbi:MAG: Stp1/IreP family PP2C-type Ser/Thr phosphatase [Deltaproteobacteria bacterium]|nr:Stp1/IreP family PP2C-type Ser/Thr phosphatase [Deltaproteobacteria bacterium]